MLQRFKLNGARLYARRWIELAAAASAASSQVQRRTQLLQQQQQEAAQAPPSEWTNWERKDWTDELYGRLGGTSLDRLWMAGVRLVSLAALATPLVALAPFAYVSDRAQAVAYDYALWGIEKAGPTFIKLIQWATTRQDMFSQEFCVHFAKLQDDTRGHSWDETQRILRKELGENYEDFLELERAPIGSGCIAQVYRGRLKQPTPVYAMDTQLAVKVQHPGIWRKVYVDFYIMGKVARFLESLPYLNLVYLSLNDTVEQFCNTMLPQLDLRQEASHLRRFNKDFEGDEQVSFPFPLDELTTPHVLTETFVHGTPIMQYVDAPLNVRKEISRLGMYTTLKMIFLNDFVHGDLHPGNVLVEKFGERDTDVRLHLLDCGLVIEMGPQQHVNLVKILGAFTRKDGRLAGQLMVDTAAKCQASNLDVELFVKGIEQICSDDNSFIEKVGDYIADICFLACKHKVKLEAAFISAALAVEITEGIATSLYNQANVQSMALPMVVKAEMMHRLPSFKLSV